jgi:hypothetical protein
MIWAVSKFESALAHFWSSLSPVARAFGQSSVVFKEGLYEYSLLPQAWDQCAFGGKL